MMTLCIINSRNTKKKIKVKMIKVMKFTFKIGSGHVLLRVTFNDKF